MKIYYYNFKSLKLKRKIKKLFLCALNKLGQSHKNVSVNLTIVSEMEIKQLNKKFRDIDKITDVLSFPNFQFPKNIDSEFDIQNFLDKETKKVDVGDIIICESVAKAQAEEYAHSFEREVCFLALHGFLHLLGFDHINQEDELKMQNLANEILLENKLPRQ